MGVSASQSLEELDETILKFRKRNRNDYNELCELVVFGYIRRLEKEELFSSLIIPLSIDSMILDFFSDIPAFRWNKLIKGYGLSILDDITIKAGSNWTSCIADFHITSEMVDWYEWTVELIDWNRELPDDDQPALMTGFVLYPHEQSIKELSTYLGAGSNDAQFMVNICYIDSFRLFGNILCQGQIKADNDQKCKFKSGDKIKLKIDFIKKQCQLWYNDIYFGIVYKNIVENGIIPAASLHQGQIKVCSWDAGYF